MRRENQDVIGDKPVRNNNGQMFQKRSMERALYAPSQCGDWNGHIGSHSTAFEHLQGGQALGKKTMKVKDCWNLLLPMSWLLVTPGSRRNLNIWLHTSQEIVKPKLTTYCIR